MGFGSAIKSGFRNYVTFSGRASRSAFWYWTLFAVLLTIAGHIADSGLFDDSKPGLSRHSYPSDSSCPVGPLASAACTILIAVAGGC
jgi:uncharacterized membrane protein YhaH (DUF805 family)